MAFSGVSVRCRPMLAAWGLVAVLASWSAGCEERSQPPPGTAKKGAVCAPATQPATRPTTQPASAPASRPASRPVSTYDSRPPYPVFLYVRSPTEDQPGWLRILKLTDDGSPATCTGAFPERNLLEVQTTNVRELRIHIGHLPLAPRKRIVLRIDGQAIELAHKLRAHVVLQRRATGAWQVGRSED